jgi:hypothetical protein
LQQNLPEAEVRRTIHLVCARQLATKESDLVERIRAFQVDDELVLGRHRHRKIGGIGAPQDTIDIARRLRVTIDGVDGTPAVARKKL